MQDEDKTKAQLVEELAYLQRRVSELEAAQQMGDELQKANDLLRAIIEAAPTAIMGLDTEGNVQMVWNPAAEKMLGWSAQEVMGKFLPTVSREKEEEFRQFRDWIQNGKRMNGVEVQRQRRDGSLIDYSIYASPLHDPNGCIIGNVAVLADISERKWAEKERERLNAQIREQAQRMEQVLDTVPMGVLLLNAEWQIVHANPTAQKDLAVLAGASMGDILTRLGNRPLAELLTSPPTKGLWHEVISTQRIFEVIAQPMDNGPGMEQWVLVINDVTREREIQTQLQQQERLAAVGQLAAGIAHDFNNIMAVIVLYTQMTLKAVNLPSQIRERLEIILQQTRRATTLIQQVLDFSRRAVIERRPMDLILFLKEMVKLLERTVPESIKIDMICGTDEYVVNADPMRLQQALMNLVVNARDAMPEGGDLRIALDMTSETDRITCVTCAPVTGEKWVRITVTDTGSGIPPDVLPHIFEPFFTTKEVGQGAGLGLAQVYGIVKKHDGHIDVATEVGKGTTFTLCLPALPMQQPEIPITEIQACVQGQGETILVVEDDAILRQALVDSLTLLEYRVLEAGNGHEALHILEQHANDPAMQEIALVLSDVVMPEMRGQTLFYTMRQRGLTMPVIMLSGHPMESALKSLQTQGLAGWMLKPPDIEQLSQLLARTLGKKTKEQ